MDWLYNMYQKSCKKNNIICEVTVSQNGHALKSVKCKITPTMVDMALAQCLCALQVVPKKFISKELVLNVVKKRRVCIKYTLSNYKRDLDIALAAIRQSKHINILTNLFVKIQTSYN